jgi:outer membrane protein OmpU
MKMKKLLCSAAVCGLALAAMPAHAADGLKLDIGGWFKGYGVWVDQDDDAADVHELDIIRHTEVHFGGETTLDNGLTVGAHFETEADGVDGFDVEESYVYFSGGWGRVNFGAEDGAAYLLQVEAPSADDNVDGLRQFVQPINYTAADAAALGALITAEGLDYEQNVSGTTDKITYLSPVFNGFQLGASFTPDNDESGTDFSGVSIDDTPDDEGSVYELAARYEGQFNNVGVILGGGYTHADIEEDGALEDDRQAWNLGADFDIGPFGIGAAYVNDDRGTDDDEEEIWVAGVDYTTGPWKFGASYYNNDNTRGIDGVETQRYSGGLVYTYGPGMTFRGSIGHVENEDAQAGGDDVDGTYVLFGTQVNF